MGRTNPTYRMQVRGLEREWSDYRRALRARDRPHFDRLFAHVDAHADAAGYVNATDPLRPALLSMLLVHERRLAVLEAALDEALDDGDRANGDAHRQATATGVDGNADDRHARTDASARTDDGAAPSDDLEATTDTTTSTGTTPTGDR